jgi:hypothetical protein
MKTDWRPSVVYRIYSGICFASLWTVLDALWKGRIGTIEMILFAFMAIVWSLLFFPLLKITRSLARTIGGSAAPGPRGGDEQTHGE